ncbi:MAG: ATP-binding protein [Lachnospiraceae bacterium]|nr:ATP-binding protein [Lachnospiraceae bacterium]
MVRKLPLGIQSFSKMRKENYIYVDKTDYIYKLAQNGGQYFLSRPRRFGKSLFLSTMKAYFSGERELFDGLAIEKNKQDKDELWEAFPVFYFDFNQKNYLKDTALEEVLIGHLEDWEQLYQIDNSDKPIEKRFSLLMRKAYESTGKRCVVLVDEYDKPLIDVMDNEKLQEHNKAVFKGFFSVLKSYDEYIQFVFITGVTKFSKVSIFSDLNQLKDISLSSEYADICGITNDELLHYFEPEVQALAVEQQMNEDDCYNKLKKEYDGYRFYHDTKGVYNPFSLLNAFSDKEFRSYWFESGTPTFLVQKLKSLNFDARKLQDGTLIATKSMLSDYQDDNPDPIPLLYQTGYLTILGYDKLKKIYTLGFPNEEVAYGLLESMMQAYMPVANSATGKDILSICRYLETGDLEMLKNALVALYASIPYTSEKTEYEGYFQSVIYIVFTLLNQYILTEVHSSIGRADAIVETDKYVYIFEFKCNKSADEALNQIDDKGYAVPYAADKRMLYKIGVNFDTTSKNIIEWKVK